MAWRRSGVRVSSGPRFRFFGYNKKGGAGKGRFCVTRLSASIAQWIEQARPKGEMWVRFLLGAQNG